MKAFTATSKITPRFLGLTFVTVVSLIYLSSCNESKLGQSYSPTSSGNTIDSAGNNGGKGNKLVDKVNGVSPMVPFFNEGGPWTDSFWLFNKYLPEDVHKGKYLMLLGGSDFASDGGYNLTALYNNYYFRRAVCGDWEVSAYTNAGFNESQLLISIGCRNDNRSWWQVFWGTGSVSYSMPSNWKSIVTQYAHSVLAFWMDEPSGLISSDSMQKIAQYIHTAGGKLWIEDYDTSPIPSNQNGGLPHGYHIWDQSMLNNADYISCNGNTSDWVSGDNLFGDNVLSIDYVEFQGAFGSKFCAIECQAMDNSGALLNNATMVNCLINNPNVNNFALYLGTCSNCNPNVTNAPTGQTSSLGNFINDAAGAGFLGTENQLYNYLYVCQQNNVIFTPPGPAGSYYGLWNGSRYTGPVDPNTQGAVLCWSLVSRTPTGQIQDIY